MVCLTPRMTGLENQQHQSLKKWRIDFLHRSRRRSEKLSSYRNSPDAQFKRYCQNSNLPL